MDVEVSRTLAFPRTIKNLVLKMKMKKKMFFCIFFASFLLSSFPMALSRLLLLALMVYLREMNLMYGESMTDDRSCPDPEPPNPCRIE